MKEDCLEKQWRLPKRSRACARSGVNFEEGQEVISQIEASKEQVVRIDYLATEDKNPLGSNKNGYMWMSTFGHFSKSKLIKLRQIDHLIEFLEKKPQLTKKEESWVLALGFKLKFRNVLEISPYKNGWKLTYRKSPGVDKYFFFENKFDTTKMHIPPDSILGLLQGLIEKAQTHG